MQRQFRIPYSLISLLFFSGGVYAADVLPEVDSALRARIQDFYQLQKSGKYREAEDLIAADTKDYYFTARKPVILTFRIVSIDYAPNFQSATVKLISSTPLPIPGTTDKPLEAPLLSNWKVEDGKWCWYVDQSKLLETPFGRVNVTGSSSTNPMSSQVNKSTSVVMADIRHAVQTDPAGLAIDANHPVTQVVTLKNTLPGPVTIQLLTETRALDIRIAKPNLGAGESTTLTISLAEGPSLPRNILLRVAPVGQEISIPITYGPTSK